MQDAILFLLNHGQCTESFTLREYLSVFGLSLVPSLALDHHSVGR